MVVHELNMASRSWNRVELIGNLTRDPELRYTPNGAAVATFGLATNRSYVSEGERKEEADFHKIVAWNKLAELCNQLLKKGSRVFISGRLQYREWETQDGQKRRDAEIVLEDMILLTPKSDNFSDEALGNPIPAETMIPSKQDSPEEPPAKVEEPQTDEKQKSTKPKADEVVGEDDLPF